MDAHHRPPRRRPPWWPPEEPWPPLGRMGRRGHPPFAWRFGCLFGAFFLVLVSVALLVLWLVGSLLGLLGNVASGEGPPGALARLAGLAVIVAGIAGLVGAGRILGRSGRTIDDLVEAAGRVEAGDYSVRVTERRPGPRELRDLARGFNTMASRLEADERQRRMLIADVSHELRTPLAVVQGNLEALLDGVHPADEAHLRSILGETAVLSRLVDDLRTLALSEAGTLAIHREPTDFAFLATDVSESFRAVAEREEIALSVDIEASMPTLDIDPLRTREVLTNLVVNGLHHTPPNGSVRITARLERGSAGAGPGLVRVLVMDTGPGIDPDVLPRLFDRFAKSADSGGSGLGLAIAKQLVLAQGGEIGAESAPGHGATIWFCLPVSPPGS